MKIRTALMGASSLAGLLVFSTPAFAADAPAASNADERVGEIVVSARKRQENLQDVPLSITAIPAAQLELRGLSEAKDLSAIAPNVSVVGATTNATAAVVSIRGIDRKSVV